MRNLQQHENFEIYGIPLQDRSFIIKQYVQVEYTHMYTCIITHVYTCTHV